MDVFNKVNVDVLSEKSVGLICRFMVIEVDVVNGW